jgi:hypothetical protein
VLLVGRTPIADAVDERRQKHRIGADQTLSQHAQSTAIEWAGPEHRS